MIKMYKQFYTYLSNTINTLLFINQAFNIYHGFVIKIKIHILKKLFYFMYATIINNFNIIMQLNSINSFKYIYYFLP